MDSNFDMRYGAPTVENLPTPGAVREWGHLWVPTLDGEPVREPDSLGFESREEAWAEAIRWVKHRAGLLIEVRLERMRECVIEPGGPVVVESVAEARQAILRYAMATLGDHGRDPGDREYRRLADRNGGPNWEDLTGCETDRRYDPDNPDAGMRCEYVLYEQGDLDGVGGLVWTFGVYTCATAPPEVWGHPPDQPCGLDPGDDGVDDEVDFW